MVCGIFVGYATGLLLQFAYISLLIFSVGSLVAWVREKEAEKGLTFIFICLSVFFLGMTLIQGERQNLARHPLATILKEKTLSLRGTICAFPKTKNSFRATNISFPLKIEQIKRKDQWQDMDGKILVSIKNTADDFKIGDQLEIIGYLRPLPKIRNPGDFDYGAYLSRKGMLGQIYIGQKAKIKILSRNNIHFIKRLASRGRDYMEKIIDLGPYDGGREALLKAMLIGKREDVDETLKQNFINTGTVHIMAISGLHLVIVMGIILFICKIAFLPEKSASIICIAFLILYAFLTGGRSSVWRAVIMAGLYLGGKFFVRQVDKWTTLSIAGLIILSGFPQALFDSGFQLTFMAVGGLMYLYPRLENILRKRFEGLFQKSASRYFTQALLVILTAQISLGPFLIYYYFQFPLITFIANLAIVPLLGIITILGFVSSLTGLVSLPLAGAFNVVNNIFLLIMDKTTAFLGNLPGQIIYIARPHPLLFLAYYLILFLIFYPLKERSS